VNGKNDMMKETTMYRKLVPLICAMLLSTAAFGQGGGGSGGGAGGAAGGGAAGSAGAGGGGTGATDMPVVTPNSNAVIATKGQTFGGTSLFTAVDADGDTLTQYDFWDTGVGGGHWSLNGTALGANKDNFVTPAQLSQVTYTAGSGTDTLWVRASDAARPPFLKSPTSSFFLVSTIEPL
jgi:hypothetical protein